ncbi:AbiTii domain-containing protein [Aequorivita antarctica]|uniref:AbiTii domain-containing protein n=1 Tax=Aequorivita antarctica TaxID=153266 RepID=A0A5C6YUN4_9FLAO|nr:hypothetical protein [Aequorivita antarctica]TXD71271.1 hypothetical protein ESU54_17425 [Aequorivita antarctica]SRX76514.1 hypothetical protein AEQU3_03514 [Aequorivita antarctica]
MKQTFLLQEVIDDLVNTDKSLSAPLMKLNYFGKLIKNQELVEYTNSELNGYKEQKENIPSYRRAIGTLYIDMQMYIHRHSGELPVSMIDEPYRSSLRYVYVREGIAAVEKLARESESNSGGQIETALPMEMLHILQGPARKLYRSDARVDVIGARLSGNANIVVEIPNAIRTKLLDFVMSIAEKFGYNVEIETFNKRAEINNQTIINQMNNTINNSGDGNIINTGNENQIENNVTLYKNDLARFQSELEKQGIDKVDIEEISEIIAVEEPNIGDNRLGEKSNSWISKIINKSLNGVGKIATGISANILATLIKQYYGMP